MNREPEVLAVSRKPGPSYMVLVLSVCCFLFGSAYQYIIGVPEQVAATAGVSLSDMSRMLTVYNLTNAFGAPVAVLALARAGQKRALLVGLVGMAAGMAITALTSSFAVMLVGRGIMGVGNGVFVSEAYMVVQRIAAPGKGAAAMANVALGFSAAYVFSLPAARMLRDVISWQTAYLILVGLAAAAFVLLAAKLYLPDASSRGARLQKQSETGGSQLRIFKNVPAVFAISSAAFLYMGCAAMNTYITPYFEQVLPEASWVSIALLVFGMVSFVGAKGAGWSADRFGSACTVVFVIAIQVVSLVAMGATPGVWLAVVLFACVWQLGIWGFVPAQNSFLMAIGGKEAGFAVSLSNSALQLGSAFGTMIAGAYILQYPLVGMPIVAAIGTVLALATELIAARLFARKK